MRTECGREGELERSLVFHLVAGKGDPPILAPACEVLIAANHRQVFCPHWPEGEKGDDQSVPERHGRCEGHLFGLRILHEARAEGDKADWRLQPGSFNPEGNGPVPESPGPPGDPPQILIWGHDA